MTKLHSLALALLGLFCAAAAQAQTPGAPHAFAGSEVLTHGEANAFLQGIDNITELRLGAGAAEMSVMLRGLNAPGDGGGGQFFWSTTNTATDDGISVIEPVGVYGAGRWLRASTEPLVSPVTPTNHFLFMLWADTALSPAPLNVWDGTAWVAIGTLNVSTNVWTPANALIPSNNLGDVASPGAARTALGLAIGTNVEAWNGNLDALAGLSGTSGSFPYFTSGSAMVLGSFGVEFTFSGGTVHIGSGDVTNAMLANPSLTIAGHTVALGATQALAASDLSNGVTGSGTVVLATSPTLTTPALGAATATTLAIGGASIGSNALAGTGNLNFSGTGTFGSVAAANSGAVYWTSRGILTSPAAGTIQFGTVDAASPVAQVTQAQSVAAGTSNTAGQNWTIAGSKGTGTGAGGSVIIQTAPAGSTGTAQNAEVAAVTVAPTGGVQVGAPTGGDKGAGTINASAIYLNGTSAVGTVTSVGSGFGLTGGPVTGSGALALSTAPQSNALATNVALNNQGAYFTGPTIAQGTTGTWCAFGHVTVQDPAAAATFQASLTDGVIVFASSTVTTATSNFTGQIALSGCLQSPAGNIRINVNDSTSTTGLVLYNYTGTAQDSVLTEIRVQ